MSMETNLSIFKKRKAYVNWKHLDGEKIGCKILKVDLRVYVLIAREFVITKVPF
jgi:hypothetical protein